MVYRSIRKFLNVTQTHILALGFGSVPHRRETRILANNPKICAFRIKFYIPILTNFRIITRKHVRADYHVLASLRKGGQEEEKKGA